MSESVHNASHAPRVYYGLHFAPGIAEYKPQDGDPYRILVNESTAKIMDPTFEGKPVYVKHVPKVELKDIQKADGYVTESFFNKADGKHWCKFIVTSDAAHEAISNGWTLSNAYHPKAVNNDGGLWHGCSYSKEYTDAEYEHLAIVPNPRYAESKILTPEQFKQYNEQKELELVRLANSQGEESVLKFFKRQTVENSADYENFLVVLPKSKTEKTISQVVNELDEVLVQNMSGYASPDHMVKLDNEEMSVKDLASKYCKMNKANEEMEEKEKGAKKNAEEKEKEDKEKDKKAENEEKKDEKESEKDAGKAKKEEEKEDKKMENELQPISDSEKEFLKKHFNALHSAPADALKKVQNEVVSTGVELGKARYGVK